MPAADEATLGDPSPSLIPGFRTLGLLGQGGMGTVLLVQPEAGGAPVALKYVLVEGLSPDRRERFLREASVLQRLAIPGVVAVHDRGSTDQVHWFTMDWVQGPSLAQVLESEAPLPPEEAVRIVHQVALALHEVHRHGLAHRDIKPSNILLHEDGGVVLADFGLLRPLQAGVATQLTRHLVGTPAYMAPELLRTQDVDWVRAEVFSLGAVLGRCLAGQVIGGAWDVTLAGSVGDAVRRAVSPRPEDRFPTAEAFARAIVAPARAARGRRVIAGALVLLLGAGIWAVAEHAGRVQNRLDPVAALIASGNVAEADRVFMEQVLEVDGATADQLWIARAELLDTEAAWASAWERVGRASRTAALQGLVQRLRADRRYEAIDTLFTAHPDQLAALDPTGRIGAETAVYQRRFGSVWKDLTPEEQRALQPLRQLTPLEAPDDWHCDPKRCVREGRPVWAPEQFFRHVPTDTNLYVWSEGEVRDLDSGRVCPVDPLRLPYLSSGIGQTLYLASTGRRPGLRVLDMATCEQRTLPGQEVWEGEYVNGTFPWDADGDGTPEIAVLIGSPFTYAVHLYDLEDHFLGSVGVGSARGAAVLDGDLVVFTEAPHGNGTLFDLPPMGAHRIHFGPDGLELVQSWPGHWRDVAVAAVDEGPEALMLIDHHDVLHLYPTPTSAPLHVADVLYAAPMDRHPEVFTMRLRDASEERWFRTDGPSPGVDVAQHPPTLPVASADERIDRARELESIGLAELAAQRLTDQVHGASPEVARRRWQEIARLWEQAGRVANAAEAWERVAAFDPTLERPIDVALQAGQVDRARKLAARGLAQSPAARDALLATEHHTFVAPPGEGWVLRPPVARWYADRRVLRFASVGGAGSVLSRTLERTSPLAGFRARVQIARMEYGAEWRIGLVDAAGHHASIDLGTWGSRGAITRQIGEEPWYAKQNGEDPTLPGEFEVIVALEGSRTSIAVRAPGAEPIENLHESGLEGPIAFEIQVRGSEGALAELALAELELWGLRASSPALPWSRAATPDSEAVTRIRLEPPLTERPLPLLERAFLDTWSVHRSRSGLADQVLADPQLQRPEVWERSPDLGLLRADVLLTRGQWAEALEVLAVVPQTGGNCVWHTALGVAAATASGEEALAADASRRQAACGATDRQLRSTRWALGLDGWLQGE